MPTLPIYTVYVSVAGFNPGVQKFQCLKTYRGLRQENCLIRLNNKILDPATLNFQIGQRITSNTNKSL